MTDSNYTHILAIIDRSGSMQMSVDVMSSALNEFFMEQAKIEGKCLVDYVQFGSRYEVTYTDRPIKDARAVFDIEGMTALLDAIGKGTIEFGTKLRALPEDERPGKVLVVVVTDGHENMSKEWNRDSVKSLITEQQDKYGWDYVFLGANIDAVAVGADFGFKSDKSLTFNIASASAVGATSAALRGYTTTYRSGGAAGFSDEDRSKAAQK